LPGQSAVADLDTIFPNIGVLLVDNQCILTSKILAEIVENQNHLAAQPDIFLQKKFASLFFYLFVNSRLLFSGSVLGQQKRAVLFKNGLFRAERNMLNGLFPKILCAPSTIKRIITPCSI